MKKNLLLILAVVLSLGVFGQAKNKQGIHTELAKNPAFRSIDALATDFTATDLDGNVHNLYTYLNAGKTVMIDLFATWCSPCWSYSQNGALEDVYATYGPGGTDEMMVFAIESDATTDTSEIYNSTLGNWTTGINYPMINDDDIAATFNLTYFPYIIMICPNGEWFEAGQGITAYYTAAEYYAMAGNCVGPNDVPVADFTIPEGSIMPNTAVDFMDNSMGLPTSWAWTFTDGTPATSTDQNPSITWTTPGTYDVTLVASNANGASAPITKQVTVQGPGEGISFEDGLIPADWTLIDADGDGQNWVTREFGGSHGDWVVSSASWTSTLGAIFPDNYLVSPQRAISAGDILKWKVKAQDQSWVSEKYQVLVSTTTPDVAGLTTQVFEEILTAGDYVTRTVDLSAYDGQNIYVAFNHYDCTDWFMMNLDEIVMPGAVVGVNEIGSHSISIYPNPSTGMVNINNVAGAKVVVYNVIGEQVVSIENANQLNAIDFSEFGVGTYYVRVVTETETTTHALSITR